MKRLISILFLALTVLVVEAQQLNGRIVDSDGLPVAFASVAYKGHHIAVSSDADGKFTIEKHVGWKLTISCLSFKSQTRMVKDKDSFWDIKLKDDSHSLTEVEVKTKSGRYRRKNNPAVELMRRVIAAKKETNLRNHDYYQFNKYQKLTLAFNDITPDQLESKFFKKRQYLIDQVEVSPYNNKLTLPISVDETVIQHIYRKSPETEKDIVMGQQSQGIGKLIQTGDALNTMLKDVFTDVDIYDNRIRLLQNSFDSPIGNSAITSYHYYIEDTVYVDKDLCYHLQFTPANNQDFGFRGELFVLADSTLHVKKCNMHLPSGSGVNWVDNMIIEQEYTHLDNGEWVLTKDDMISELHVSDLVQNALVVRHTRMSDYSFDEIPKQVFRGKGKVKLDIDALNRDEAYWNQYRQDHLTKSEKNMNSFVNRIEKSKGWSWIAVFMKAMMENYVETSLSGKPSYFDFGPVNTLISKNYVDDLRFRLSGRTMAALNPHLFWDGYVAYGTKSQKWYYGSEITYSLNKKKHSPFEFPRRNLIFESTYDVMSASDLNLVHNKDNIFMTFRASSQDKMYFYNRQMLSFVYETDGGFRFNANMFTQLNETAGELHYYINNKAAYGLNEFPGGIEEARQLRMSAASITLGWNPGVTYINTKQQRKPINLDSPEVYLKHTMGFKGVFGSHYKSNLTEVGFYKRQWLGSWGCIDIHAHAKAQWEQVPFPMLILAPINLSYFEHEGNFNLMKDWEFLNDREVFWSLNWDMNGKIFNRLPLIRKLKWREHFALKGMIGELTDKNNPLKNIGNENLFMFPNNTHIMNKQPYWEAVAGVTNIFKLFTVEYVRRLTYNYSPAISKWGVRFGFDVSF